MSGGAAHYAAAEAIMLDLEAQTQVLKARGRIPWDELRQITADMSVSLQAAQVHATLAAAAATIAGDNAAWQRVLG